MKKPIFIAEVKNKSPFGFYSDLALPELWHLANQYGDWISIHTDFRWGGSFKWLKWCCANTTKPVLAKGIHSTDDEVKKALDCGADYVLVVDRVPAKDLIDKCLIELSFFDDFKNLSFLYPNAKFVRNARDLKTGKLRQKNDFDDWRFFNHNKVWLCEASGIHHPAMVSDYADAFIVGTHLAQFINSK